MRNSLFLASAAALALGGCAMFGGGTKPLDEFAVARSAPLIIPPDFTLVPPAPGTIGVSASDAQAQAVEALFGGPAPRSAGETSLLDNAGRDRAAIGARSVAGDPATIVVDKGTLTQAIIAAPPADGQDASAQTGQ